MSLSFAFGAAQAAVTAKDAWVRGTVPVQKVTGAFMTLTSTEDAKVVAIKSPAAGRVEIHASTMEGGVMQMREQSTLALPAGKSVKLEPGGYHVMLMDLVKPLTPGEKVPLVLTVEDAKGRRSVLEVKADVRPLAP